MTFDMDAFIRAAAGYSVGPADAGQASDAASDPDALIRALAGRPAAAPETEEPAAVSFDGGVRGGGDIPRDPVEEFDDRVRAVLSIARMYSPRGDGGWTP